MAGNDDRFVFVSGSEARDLGELCEAACAAESVEEFERVFLAAQEQKQSFERLLRYWKCAVPTAIERLRRIEVRTIGERDLEDKVRWGVRLLYLADSRQVLSELRAIVEDSVHRTITRQDLVEALSRRGYRMRRLPSPENAGVAVWEATEQHLDAARPQLIRQRLVPRTAAETLLSRLGETATDSVVTGKAGSGKTACVVEVTDALRERGLPVLTFRLDRISFSSVSTTADLGRHLDLEESPVLVLAAAAEAAGRPGVLIVDQLDAVSTMSGRSPSAFDVVERLLQEARGTRARAVIHTVVVCRAFDWQHDHRLRRLLPSGSDTQVEVTEFTVDEVKPLLTDAGFDPARFRERQLALLRLPQNLSLFLEAGFDTPAFDTATELFARYWTEKRGVVAERISPSPDQWMKVMEALCDEMASAQQLSVPCETLDDFSSAYVKLLASEGVLTFDGRRYGFGHESFFDYCFARVFFRRQESLVSFLKGSEQHLFRRAQVRQVLAYLRDADRAQYAQELRGLLSDEGIRAHIKDLVFALLAEVTDPDEEEWAIRQQWIAPALKAIEEGTPNPDKLSEIAWGRFFGASSWFTATDQRGVIEDWLASGNDRFANVAVNYLGRHQRRSPDRVAALLEPYADRGGEWIPRLQSLMEWADLHTSRCFFDLFLRLVDNDTLDEDRGPIAENTTFWDMLHVELPRFSGQLRTWVSCSVLIAPLEGHRGLLTEALVTTMGVIPSLDELEDGSARLVVVVEVRAVEQLAFEGGEEALGHGVVEAVPDRAHRRDHAPSPAAFTEGEGGVLAALIGVVDDGARAALFDGHAEGIEHEFGAQVPGHRPAHDSAAEHVEDDGQVQESRQGRHVGDVSHPQPVRGVGVELTLHQVRCRAGLGVAACGARPLAPAHAGQARLAHHPSHPLAAHWQPLLSQLGLNPRAP